MPAETKVENKKAGTVTRSGTGTKRGETKLPRGRGGLAFSIVVVALTAGGYWFWSTQRSAPAGPAVERGAVKGALHLETFVLNLADPGQRSYLRVGIDLGLNREAGKGEDAPPVGQVRDTILGVLAESRVEDLMTAKGKEKLKEDLLHALQERMPGMGVEEVYFTEFLVQR